MSRPSRESSRTFALHPSTLVLLVVSAVIAVLLWAQFDPVMLYNDSFQHASAARSLADGEGYKTSIVYYDQNYAQQSMPVPQTVWPPGVAAFASVFVVLGLDALTAVFVVSLLGLMLCPLFAHRAARAAGLGPYASLLVALTSICLGLLLYITSRAGTEGPFIAATLIALAGASVLSCRPDSVRAGLALIAVGTTLAVCFRYNGLFLVMSTGCWFLLNAIRRRSIRPFLHGVVSLAPAAVTGLAILGRNIAYTGSLTGGPVSESWSAPGMVLKKLVEALVSTAGFNPSSTLQLILLLVLVVAVLVTVVVMASTFLLSASSPAAEGPRDVVSFCLLYIAVTALLLILVLAPRALDALGYRYLLPLIPFWAMAAGIALTQPAVSEGHPRILRSDLLRQSSFYLTVVAILAGNALALSTSWRAFSEDESVRQVEAALDETWVDGRSLRDRLSESVSRDAPLLSSSAQRLGGLTGWPVLGLTPGLYSLYDWNAEDVHEVVRQYGVCYVLVYRTDTESRIGGGRELFADLRAGRVPPWLNLYAESEWLTVFEVSACRPAPS